MGKLFRGLAQGGFWVCLDEFNRIDIEVRKAALIQLNDTSTSLTSLFARQRRVLCFGDRFGVVVFKRNRGLHNFSRRFLRGLFDEPCVCTRFCL